MMHGQKNIKLCRIVLTVLRFYLTHVVLTEIVHSNGKLIRTNIPLCFIKQHPRNDISRKRGFSSRFF